MKTFLVLLILVQAIAVPVYSIWGDEMINPKLYQGDIVLDPDESVWSASMRGGRWPNGVVPYLIHESLQTEPRALKAIKAAIADYHKYTCIRFQPKSSQGDHVVFTQGTECSSPVGYRKGRVNRITLSKRCWVKGKVMHEMGHTMGFWHEQSRPDRDNYVQILWKNIQHGMEYNFNKYTTEEIDTLGAPYDLESMMHYSTALFTKNGKRTIKVLDYSKRLLIGQIQHFSNTDVKQLNLMYKCPVYKGTVPPKVCKDVKGIACHAYKRRGHCTNPRSESEMYLFCCKTCYGHAAGKGGPHTWPSATLNPTAPVGCVDRETKKNCTYWARLGNCHSKQSAMKEFMKKNCCATCRDHGY